MSETLQTNFNDVEVKGRVSLFRNHLCIGGEYFGRFERNTVTTRTLIARIQNRKTGTNELNVQQIAGFLKEEILAALRAGEAVNVMDLCTFYIRMKGKFDGTSFVTKDGSAPFKVKFTPSPLVQSTVENIRISDVQFVKSGMAIKKFEGLFEQQHSFF